MGEAGHVLGLVELGRVLEVDLVLVHLDLLLDPRVNAAEEKKG